MITILKVLKILKILKITNYDYVGSILTINKNTTLT